MEDKMGSQANIAGGSIFLIFLVLKLTGTVNWSWWMITLPLWLPWAIIGTVLVGVTAVAAIMTLIKK